MKTLIRPAALKDAAINVVTVFWNCLVYLQLELCSQIILQRGTLSTVFSVGTLSSSIYHSNCFFNSLLWPSKTIVYLFVQFLTNASLRSDKFPTFQLCWFFITCFSRIKPSGFRNNNINLLCLFSLYIIIGKYGDTNMVNKCLVSCFIM